MLFAAMTTGFMNFGAIYGFIGYILFVLIFQLFSFVVLGENVSDVLESKEKLFEGLFNDFSVL